MYRAMDMHDGIRVPGIMFRSRCLADSLSRPVHHVDNRHLPEYTEYKNSKGKNFLELLQVSNHPLATGDVGSYVSIEDVEPLQTL